MRSAALCWSVKLGAGEEVEVTGGKVGSAGGRARARSLSREERSEIAAKAAKARWSEDGSQDLELKMTGLSLLKRELFGNPDSAIADIKFFPGESTESATDEIAGAILAALADVKDGNGEDIDLSF